MPVLNRIGKDKQSDAKIFRHGELFCGPGGLSLGAQLASVKDLTGQECIIEHIWANDYDTDSCRTYAHNIDIKDKKNVICEDVHLLDIESLPPIDAFSYGFPCNDFSLVGEQKGFDGKFGPLYTYGLRVLNKFKPKFFVAENVSGITSANSGSAFHKILDDLACAGNGYWITPHLYKAEEYGVPQTRHRVVMVGIDKSFGFKFRVPSPTNVKNYVTSKQALEVPPIPSNAFNNELKNQSPTVIERLKYTKPGENAWTANLPDHLKLNVKSARMSQIYRRLHPDKPSYTMTASGGGGTHGYHYSEPRALTNRERARIQTFPDNFEFLGKIESVRKQIGMAVPPLLAKVIFTAVLKSFSGIEYLSIPQNVIHNFKEKYE